MTNPYTESAAAERSVVGSMLAFATSIPDALAMLSPSDFASPAYAEIFSIVSDLWGRGVWPDSVMVIEEVMRRDSKLVTPADLVSIAADAVTSRVGPHARTVAEYAARRRLWAMAEKLKGRSRDLTCEIGTLVHDVRAELDRVQLPGVDVSDTATMIDFCAGEDPPNSWAVPALIDVEDRIVVVAPEGRGKSVCLRQIALAVGQGIHPFTFRRIPPVTTLLVDLENPGRVIRDNARPMVDAARLRVGDDYDPDRTWIWHRRGGINLLNRTSVAEFDAVCAKVKPRVVCLGPLYKAFRGDSGRREHDIASEVAGVFDDLRTRHGFALIIEHHAPLQQGAKRDMRPFGSLLWTQWPEVGIKLTPDEKLKARLNLGFWRGSRVERAWPNYLDRSNSGQWPWEAGWKDGMPADPGEAPALDDF